MKFYLQLIFLKIIQILKNIKTVLYIKCLDISIILTTIYVVILPIDLSTLAISNYLGMISNLV